MDKFITPGWFGVGLVTLNALFFFGPMFAALWVGVALIVHAWFFSWN